MRSIPSASADGNSDEQGSAVSQNVIALGSTSFFSDISSEMVAGIVPIFLTVRLGFSDGWFAAYEAAYLATNAFFRIWGGALADNRQNHKRTAAIGYSLSALTRVGLVASMLFGGWALAIFFLLADRVGKGLRTAPRDALISLSTPPHKLGLAFGIHRAMDTAGAMIGPLLAAYVLWKTEDAYDPVFVISAAFAAIGVSVIWLFAEEKPQRSDVSPAERPAIRSQWRDVWETAGVPSVAVSVALLSLFTIGDAFIYLVFQQTNNLSAEFPLLFAGTAVVYLLLAMPFGRLADRIGTRPVFLAGNALLIALYLVVGYAGLGLATTLLCLGLLGGYYAATDGVIPAMVSRLVDGEIRASGIAFITVVIVAGRILSAGLYATLTRIVGTTNTMVFYAVAMTLALLFATRNLSTIARVND